MSSTTKQDSIIVNARGSAFASKGSGRPMKDKHSRLAKKMRGQMGSSGTVKAFMSSTASVGSATTAAVAIQLSVNYFFAGLMSQLLAMINSAQLIFLQPGLPISYPANVRFFFETLMPFVTFDFLPSEYTTELIFDFDDNGE